MRTMKTLFSLFHALLILVAVNLQINVPVDESDIVQTAVRGNDGGNGG